MIAIFLSLLTIFILSIFVGYLTNGETIKPILEEFTKITKLDPLTLAVIIFANNSFKSFLALILGSFFGIFPITFVITNGYILGAVIALKKDIGLSKILLAILPHGIIEIPAVLIASSYGVFLGYRFFLRIFRKQAFKPHLVRALKVYFKIVLPMLLVAALIEAFITPVLIRM
ncbi:MAG: stage II sporulation protein M [Archaeoglobaceae archaeon]|nr:stage II sporulation protein M [Archaeoglobaceae archaeon]MCX8151602.1 stage II sporulation protein M [Archaeoglobaceae archaeon]MDW8013120.1 stage II sporulation protein M [Archaeoglobaceae archaeon]